MNQASAGLSGPELQELKQELVRARARVTGDLDQLEQEAHSREHEGESLAPASQTNVGRELSEMQLAGALQGREKNLLWAIDHALERMEAGTYGLCEESGRPVGIDRLRAKPWARFCIEVEREHEKQG